MLVVDSAVGLLKQPVERLHRPASNFLDPGIELPPILPLDREHVAGSVDPPSVAVGSREYGGAPLATLSPDRREDPHRVYLGRRHRRGDRLRKATPAQPGQADACSHRSQ